MILFGLRGVGSGNACLPAVSILKDMGIAVSVYAEEPAYSRFKDKSELIPESGWPGLLDSVQPSLVVLTCSAIGGFVPLLMMREAKRRKLPVVLVEDNWSSHSSFDWIQLPDGVCVVDEFAQRLILNSWPNYPKSKIHITGAPVYDKFVNIASNDAKHNLREVLGLSEDWPIILFNGENWGMTRAVAMMVDALNSLGRPVYFILRDHPTMIAPNASDEYQQLRLEYRRALEGFSSGTIVDSSKLTSDKVLVGSDIVVGICSTMLEEACYLQKKVINIWTPEIGQILLDRANYSISELPIASFGASWKAQSISEIADCLYKFYTGATETMPEAQKKYCKTDGLSGRRVAAAILKYYA